MEKKKIIFVLPMLNGGGAERVAVNYMRQLDLIKYVHWFIQEFSYPNIYLLFNQKNSRRKC